MKIPTTAFGLEVFLAARDTFEGRPEMLADGFRFKTWCVEGCRIDNNHMKIFAAPLQLKASIEEVHWEREFGLWIDGIERCAVCVFYPDIWIVESESLDRLAYWTRGIKSSHRALLPIVLPGKTSGDHRGEEPPNPLD